MSDDDEEEGMIRDDEGEAVHAPKSGHNDQTVRSVK